VGDLASALGADLRGDGSPDVVLTSGIAMGSGDVVPGDVFVAVGGAHAHGARYASDAVAAGAVAVLTDEAGAALVAQQGLAVPVLVVADPRAVAGRAAAWVYDEPGERLVTVGVTGTNGKTTTAYFVDAALRAVHPLTAVLGTVELRIGDEAIESPRTSVEAPVLQAIAALALERGATALTTEVSSHGLALGRLRGLRFDVVAFTNLQRDHLDFHGDMEGYFAAKSLAFAPEQARAGVVVVDDEWGRRLAHEAPIPVTTVATHVGAPEGDDADWAVVEAQIGLDGVGSSFVLRDPDGVRHAAASPLPGLVNVSNAATAIVVAQAAGVPLGAAIAAIEVAHEIPGRMERVVERGDGFPLCLVDYAHTPDALVLALEAVRPITPGRLVIVLGSDGDRDRGKRPIMGAIAARLADVVVVTDENPRSEEPGSIRTAILAGALGERPGGRDVVEVTTSRADAIRHALTLAGDADTVIVTGKGHEPTQEIAGVFHRYNDRDVFLAVRASRGAVAQAGGAA
jgi:UDP-N-acetylmuramoyl-L-alanyl-D-glutamate--2,6-diaminopimelate ligase